MQLPKYQVLKHNLNLLINDPRRAFYFVEGYFFWGLFRKSILKNLKVAIQIDKDYQEKFFEEQSLAVLAIYFETSRIKVWALRRYMRKYNSCRPCFEGSGCEKCGCAIDPMFMSSIKCKSRDSI